MPQGWLGVVQLLQWRGKKRGERHIENCESLHITLIMYLITVNIRFACVVDSLETCMPVYVSIHARWRMYVH